jgi:hypothetical protein
VCCESWHLLSDIFVGNARGDLPALRDDQAAARDETMSSQDVLFLGCFFKFEKKKKMATQARERSPSLLRNCIVKPKLPHTRVPKPAQVAKCRISGKQRLESDEQDH